MNRPRGLSVRTKLALSYAAVTLAVGAMLTVVVWLFLLRYVPDMNIVSDGRHLPNRTELWEAFAPRAVQMMGLLAVVGLVGGWLLAGRMLAPLTHIRDGIRVAGQGALSHRIALPGRADELRELADSFDVMLERVERQVDEQQRFAANASHELRTPLAITQTLLEVAKNDPERDEQEVFERLEEVNARAVKLTEALLLLSRAGHQSFASERVDLSLLAEETVETLLPLAEQRNVTVEVGGDVAVAAGSSALLQQVTTNLVQNAIVHNLPQGGAVRVTTSVDGDQVRFAVENTGVVLNDADVRTLTDPFQRHGPRTQADHGGVGLGLAIVARIVEAHHGAYDLSAQDCGGLRVTVTLPKAASVTPAGISHP